MEASSVTDPGATHATEVNPKLSGIRGWLILPAFGLVLGSIFRVMDLLTLFASYFEVAASRYGGTAYAAAIAVGFPLLVFTIYAAVLFFQRKRQAPNIMIALYCILLAESVVVHGFELSSGAELFATESAKHLLGSIGAAAIWIPYFRLSKRVHSTFVR